MDSYIIFFSALSSRISQEQKVDSHKIRWLIDGDAFSSIQSCKQLGLRDGDVIDWHLEQTGGADSPPNSPSHSNKRSADGPPLDVSPAKRRLLESVKDCLLTSSDYLATKNQEVEKINAEANQKLTAMKARLRMDVEHVYNEKAQKLEKDTAHDIRLVMSLKTVGGSQDNPVVDAINKQYQQRLSDLETEKEVSYKERKKKGKNEIAEALRPRHDAVRGKVRETEEIMTQLVSTLSGETKEAMKQLVSPEFYDQLNNLINQDSTKKTPPQSASKKNPVNQSTAKKTPPRVWKPRPSTVDATPLTPMDDPLPAVPRRKRPSTGQERLVPKKSVNQGTINKTPPHVSVPPRVPVPPSVPAAVATPSTPMDGVEKSVSKKNRYSTPTETEIEFENNNDALSNQHDDNCEWVQFDNKSVDFSELTERTRLADEAFVTELNHPAKPKQAHMEALVNKLDDSAEPTKPADIDAFLNGSESWNDVHKRYAHFLITLFANGKLPISSGTRLRGFLASRFNCDPDFISKKLSQDSLYEENVMVPYKGNGFTNNDWINSNSFELDRLKDKFVSSLNQMNPVDLSFEKIDNSNLSSKTYVQSRKFKEPVGLLSDNLSQGDEVYIAFLINSEYYQWVEGIIKTIQPSGKCDIEEKDGEMHNDIDVRIVVKKTADINFDCDAKLGGVVVALDLGG